MKTDAKTIKLILATIFIAQFAYFYPSLPESVAIHFNAAGLADNFTSRQNYFLLELALLAFAFFFAKINSAFVNVLPVSLINMPHREYWLADERRAATLKILEDYFGWLSAAMLAFFIALNQLTIDANFRDPVRLSDGFWFVLAGFLVFIAFWMYKFITRFNKLT